MHTLGDLAEMYQKEVEMRGAGGAKIWYWAQVMRAVPPQIKDTIVWRTLMLIHYVRIALRTMRRQKSYSFINIAGLSVGMVCAILIFMWVHDELNYDGFHERADRIFRLIRINTAEFSESVARVGAPLGPALMQDYGEVENFVRFRFFGRCLVASEEKRFYEDNGLYADPSLFEVFSFPVLSGDPAGALAQPGSIVITERMALKYFGDDDAVGKTMAFDNRQEMRVTAVVKNIPDNSHFHFDFLVPFSMYEAWDRDRWLVNNFHTYLLLRDRVYSAQLEKKLPEFIRRHTDEEGSASSFVKLQPMTEIHLHSHFLREFEANGDIRYVYMFSAIAFFILAIACFNFINLTTARASSRAKEIGLRKVVGSNRTQLVQQFLGESVLICLCGLLIAVILIKIFLPSFNSLTGKTLSLSFTGNTMFILGLIALAVLVGLISGAYPSLILSGFQPVSVLKGRIKTNTSSLIARRVLVFLQFTISVILIAGALVVYRQLDYIQNKKLGFDKERMLVVRMDDSSIRQAQDAFRNELLKDPSVRAVSATSNLLGGGDWGMPFHYQGAAEGEEFASRVLVVDHHFLNTYGVEIVKGRNFSELFSTDEAGAFLLNEAAVTQLGWDDPIGKKFGMIDEPEDSGVPPYEKGRVIGVVKNFNFRSLHQNIQPLAMFMMPEWFNFLSVKISPENIPGTLNRIERLWGSYENNRPFDYFFLDETFDRMYMGERRMGKTFWIFSLIAISIACLGLFSLSAFTIERRTKEMGIRKVLGASSQTILLQTAKDFVKVVLLSNLFAWPLAYYAMYSWLERFAYRMNLGLVPFLLSGMLVLMVALFTVSFQSLKAARTDPVEALRYE